MVKLICPAYPALMSFLMGLILVWMLGGEYTTAGATLGREVIGPKAVGQSLLHIIYYWLRLPQCCFWLRWLLHSILVDVNRVQKRKTIMGNIPLEHGLIVATILLHWALWCNGTT